jgi:hypothetical protein
VDLLGRHHHLTQVVLRPRGGEIVGGVATHACSA